MWVVIVIFSAVFLGIYDVFKKLSLTHNAVLPVMLISSGTSLLFFIPGIILSTWYPNVVEQTIFFVPFSGSKVQFLIFLKSCIVQASWVFSFFALKHLPISIVSPIRSSGPMWTLLGAIFILGETLSVMQWGGVVLIIACLYAYSLAGRKEGIHFRNNIWIACIFAGTILGSISALYDKYLLATCGIHKMEIQAWFSVYQFLLMIPFVLLVWYPNRTKTDAFSWRWTIPLIGVFLVLADFFYFYALSIPGALISVVSIIRRSGVIISFLSGVIIFKEHNGKTKAFLLAGVLVGVYILYINR
ncbi:MAG TPA: EamA family transporter [Bacteroidales bacterium]|nr:MAG: EamA-like transporter family protein [Bacteroidetes bacterium ADurb.Bin217]HPH15671.1 EamA family transporter [Bacteroidales bacterium]